MRSPITAVFVLLAPLAVGACSSGKATEAECQQFADHFVALMSKGSNAAESDHTTQVAKEMARDFQDLCLSEGTSAQVQCALAATTMEALQGCRDLQK